MLSITFTNGNGTSLTINGLTFLDCLKKQLQPPLNTFKPLAIIANSGAIFYYDENSIHSYINEYIDFKEFSMQTLCQGLWRNTDPFVYGSDDVDAGSLFKEINKILYLIDNDRHVEMNISSNFTKII